MQFIDAIEKLVKNPLLGDSLFKDFSIDKRLIESYKNSDHHKIREYLSQKTKFSDMTHVIPDMNLSNIYNIN